MSESIARKFHEVYERLAPDYGYVTREETRDFDPESPNGQLMIAVCAEVLYELEAKLGEFENATLCDCCECLTYDPVDMGDHMQCPMCCKVAELEKKLDTVEATPLEVVRSPEAREA